MRTTRIKHAAYKKAMLDRLSSVNEFKAEYQAKEPNEKKTYKFTGTIISDVPHITIERIVAAAERSQERIRQAREFYGKDLGLVFQDALKANNII